MQIQYCCPFWGCEKELPEVFVKKVLSAGYDGIEILLPGASDPFTARFFKALEEVQSSNPDFRFIAQQLTAPHQETVAQYIAKMEKQLLELVAYQPYLINSHTGKDYYSFEDNCRVLEAAMNISQKTGVRILHETHRGRFSFHAATLLPYLQQFPELELVGDFSHFCTVSESLLDDQADLLQEIIPHVAHLHARVGQEQGPQVADPFAREWQRHLAVFEGWWQQIVQHRKLAGTAILTITPEFGPAPYMPLVPFTQQPLGNQWAINCKMMQHLKDNLHS